MCILAVSGTKNDPGTLEAYQSPCSNALPCLSRVLATDSSSIHWDLQPACRSRAFQCKCPVPCSQTNKDRAHLERNRVLSICSTGVPASVSEMFEDTQHGLAHFPHHTSAIHQNLRVPTFRWLRIQLFTFADFSVEERLCVVGHKSFVSLITCGCPVLLSSV